MKAAVLGIWLAVFPEQGQLLDRIAVTVDDRVITLGDVIEEIRLAALLDGTEVVLTPESKRRAAERLVENILLSRDMELTRFPLPTDEEVEDFVARIRSARGLDAEAWRAEMQRCRLDPGSVREQLRQRLGVLRYIEFRFRPQVQLADADVRQYVRDRTQTGSSTAAGNLEHALEAARQKVESALAAQRINELVDAWLKDAKQRSRIRFREAAFQ
ncbi:MAG: hypothetical protein RMI94_09120 [Bryobacterales bacterium]|nr:hypothetical protein [Bryobacteraceae bacterium]MDW8130696.1 hypothetical protein [Bryobacterales bacterium]